MNLYVTSSKQDFLKQVANYIIENFSNTFYHLKVIMPNELLCLYLQKLLINKLGCAILPNIIPISEMSAENEEVFKITATQIGKISQIEEKLILAQIINKYPKLNYSIEQGLSLSTRVANLFFELEINNIEIQTLKDILPPNQAQHWDILYEFISFAYFNWKDNLIKLQKSSKSAYQRIIFESEISRLKLNTKDITIIAGICGGNFITNQFISEISKLANGHIILPPLSEIQDLNSSQIKPEDALYQLSKLLKHLKVGIDRCKPLANKKSSVLDKLISNSNATNLDFKISYIEFDNIFLEAAYVANKCEEIISRSPNANIAIITNSYKAKEYYNMALTKNKIKYNDFFGTDILKLNVISYLISIAENLCSEFSLKRFFKLIFHPGISCKYSLELKLLIIKHNPFANSLDTIKAITTKHNNSALVNWFTVLYGFLATDLLTLKFNYILKKIISIAESLYPQIWDENSMYKISESLLMILKSNWDYQLNSLADFPNIFRQLLSGGRVYSYQKPSNVIICNPSDTGLINFDHVIMADLNEGVFPMPAMHNPWMNKHIQIELGLDCGSPNMGISLYNFYLNLHNTEVIITRAKKQGGTRNMLPSPLLLMLEHIIGNRFVQYEGKTKNVNTRTNSVKFAQSFNFPTQISATDIEMLVRAPYNFYAKKILKLHPFQEPDDRPQRAEFGNFFHECVHRYTIEYDKIEHDKLNYLIQISQHILQESVFPEQTKKIWNLKFAAIAEDFIEFDTLRRQSASMVYSEIRGELNLILENQNIKIIAIADRIEINHFGNAVILDYKTGTIPTKKEILTGLSPQLIIGALIIMEGGFFDISKKLVEKLIYVKINSSKPYLKTTEIILSKDKLLKHKSGLVALLNHYIKTKQFPIEPNLMKYDYYSHLARRM